MSTFDVQSDEERRGMQDAVDRVRQEKRGKDIFGVGSEQPNHIKEAVQSLEKEQPEAGLKGYSLSPQYGPVEPPPKEPPSVAPAPEAPPEQPFKPDDMPVQTSAAPAPSPKLSAVADLHSMIDRLGAGAVDAPGLGDADIAAAQGRDRAQLRHDNFTRAISAGLLRQPYSPAEPQEGSDLLKRRMLAEQKLQRQTSAQEALVKALTGDDKGLTPYQQAQLAEQARDNDYRSKHDAELAVRHEDDAKRSQENIDVARQGVEAQRDFNRTLAGMQFQQHLTEQKDKKERQVEEDTKDLANKLSDVGSVQTTANRLLKGTEGADIPGAGIITSRVPGFLLSPEGRQNRADMLKLIQWERHQTTGVAFSPAEAEEYAKIYGYDSSPEVFREGARRLAAEVADIIKKKTAGYTPQAVGNYVNQGGVAASQVPQVKPSGKSQADIGPDDFVTLRRNDGDTIRATRREAEAYVAKHNDAKIIFDQ